MKLIQKAIDNTLQIADMVENIDIGLGQDNQMPIVDIPKEFANGDDYVEHLIWLGFNKRFKNMTNEQKEKRRQRINEELPVIKALHYSEYFIMLQMLTNAAKAKGIPLGYSRGSGGNCLCLYCLGVTQIDSVRWKLDFSRFANLGRRSMADYDMDISKERRREIVTISEELFGKENVAPICTYNTLSTKVAIRDIGKVLDEDPESPYYKQIPYNIRDEVAKMIPTVKTLDDLGEEVEKEETLQNVLSVNPKMTAIYQKFPKWFFYVLQLERVTKEQAEDTQQEQLLHQDQ
jgi:DNA polymerase-3 subunit alpha